MAGIWWSPEDPEIFLPRMVGGAGALRQDNQWDHEDSEAVTFSPRPLGGSRPHHRQRWSTSASFLPLQERSHGTRS
ncbi:unnamed protein product [Urochloa humidicola]